MIFRYTAKNKEGKTQKGEMEAVSQLALARLLRTKGFYVVSVEAVNAPAGKSAFANLKDMEISFGGLIGGVPLEEKMIFSRNLSVMLSSGIPLTRALTVLAKQVENKKFKKAIEKIRQDIERGKNFSAALKEQKDIFNDLYVSMVKAGETAGNLDESLTVLANQMEKEHELRSRIRGALMYPGVIVTVMIGIGILMLATVVPSLKDVFDNFGAELPKTTQAILNLGEWTSTYWWVVLAGLPVLALAFKKGIETPPGRRVMAWILLHVPLFKGLSIKINNALFARTLSSLISGGVPILDGLNIASHTVSNVYYRESLLKAREGVKKGQGLYEVLQKYPHLYTPLVIEMIEVGEETGKLSDLLSRTATFYEDEVSDATKNMSSIIEPILMVIIGAVVGFFAISVIQPIYGLLGQV